MKKFLSILLCVCVMGAVLVACGSKEAGGGKGDDKGSQSAPQGGSSISTYTIEGVTVTPGEDFAKALSVLGEPDDFSEAASCYFDGNDKTYTYDGFEITTYPDGDIDRISTLSISSDKYKTDKGITVGAAASDVTEAYGEAKVTGNMYKYYSDDSSYLYFFVLNDTVKYFGVGIDAGA